MDAKNRPELSGIVDVLCKKPHSFELFSAMYLLEKLWLNGSELDEGRSSNIKIVPDENLSFPVSEVKGCSREKSSGKVVLKTRLLGLYGVNSPLPNYFLESALGIKPSAKGMADENSGKRVRDFFDILNHRLYCLMYSGWKKNQALLVGRGQQDYKAIKDAISGENKIPNSAAIHYGLNGHRVESSAGLALMVSCMLPHLKVNVDDSIPHWVDVDDKQVVGKMDIGLGNGVALGSCMLVAGGKVRIEFGPMNSSQCAELLPGGKYALKLRDSLESYIKPSTDYDVCMRVVAERTDIQTLIPGHLELGKNTWLGENPAVTKTIRFSRKQISKQAVNFNQADFALAS